ncbi:MAG: methylated-DNA--[protein]-cysteine S-methyltransferase [Chloroflexi bacterium]|nr:methylated-DNA--[protein]-cysteine S-methyltransferase [Chloroflexota bacterium]
MTTTTARTAAYDLIASPVGTLFVGASAAGLHRVEFVDPGHDEAALAPRLARDAGGEAHRDAAHADPGLHAAIAALDAYFAGRATAFELPLAPRGTPFQLAVWRALLDIPPRRTCSYGTLARAAGWPGAARAVGAAVGRNPLAVVVPCHRVIGANGTLTGYGGGLDRKRWLLAHEAQALA